MEQAAEYFPSLPQKYLNLRDFSILRPSLGLSPKVPKNNQLKGKRFAKRRTPKDSKCRQENRFQYFYELWQQRRGADGRSSEGAQLSLLCA